MSNEINKKQQEIKEKMQQQKYQSKVDNVTPKPPLLKNICWAFVVGGLICTLGQLITDYFLGLSLQKKEASACATAVLVFLGAFFTGIGVYDDLGKRAGAGSIVPITGFANSIVAPAMEFKREGYVFGVGAKMFVIAGPVLVYGMVTAFIIGLIYWIRQ
ncbi:MULTISPECIES: stage V sporulation protein AC [Pelosinus]|uniref:Stage V sporulation protein AC n=1 Tax=Pelosinus fermentans B4 TaxID=1149862 RepID=I8RFX0_9FIRM|nr:MULTISPECIES: stage V sporulation protein AC [Pelosinus]EIW18463.1 stage V sporulation protein AC [Pelosinus fermentans B4]EIW24477.1 stage V sporulation protein AC [Pelosinus fermentans A11]OAM94465.1 stage V sporulation protein AC [Pelosinus fermentans DSM 17108]SDR09831.1 stage V sporulation protein AC [Pelosinus fermentans]